MYPIVPDCTSECLQGVGAGVYFNVPNLDGQCSEVTKAKYAVVERSVLCEELRDWKTLYLSGRLHKPVVTLVPDDGVEEANQVWCVGRWRRRV